MVSRHSGSTRSMFWNQYETFNPFRGCFPEPCLYQHQIITAHRPRQRAPLIAFYASFLRYWARLDFGSFTVMIERGMSFKELEIEMCLVSQRSEISLYQPVTSTQTIANRVCWCFLCWALFNTMQFESYIIMEDVIRFHRSDRKLLPN